MFDLLSNNANAVATALLNIHTLVYGQGELKGILDFQAEVCQSAMASWASTANFQSFAGHNQNTSGYGPNNGPGCDCSQLVTVPPATLLPQAITGSVIPTFQAILNSMGQGLMFLGAAWQNTLNDNLLTQHISNIRAVVQKMNSFWTGYSNPAALDTFVCTLVNSYKQTCGDLGTLTDVTNPNNTVPGTQPFSNDWVFWFLPPSQDFSDPWYSISSGVVNIGPTVTSLGGSYAAYRLGVGWGEGNGGGDVASRIWGLVCASASVTIPVPGSLFPSAPPADLSAFLNVVQGAVTPSLIVVYPGMAPQGLISNVLGQAPSTATWSIEPSDGSAGSVANQAGNPANATYSAPATVASPFLGSIVVTLNGAVTLYVPLVLLPLQPTIQVTPTATLITPPNPVSFKASVPGCDWTLVPAGVGSIDGQGNYTPPPAVDTPTSIVVVASTSSPAAVGFACVCVAPPS
jgi:hypothetical protein